MRTDPDDQREWLETDGLGGFASGTVGGIRTRRYHGLLLAASNPPTGRAMLVNGIEAFVTTSKGRFPLSTQRYAGDVVYPEGFRFIESFTTEPCPTWRFRLPDGTEIEQQLCIRQGAPLLAMRWRIASPGRADARLEVRPLLSGRDFHSMHHENLGFRFDPTLREDRVTWQPYAAHPPITACANAKYEHQPTWYRNFLYSEERNRGFPASEDLGSPGTFTWPLGGSEAVLVLGTAATLERMAGRAEAVAKAIRDAEAERRRQFPSPVHRAADQYVVKRGAGKSIIAGYPWFGDWGRDSFISIRGLCIASGRLEDARQILLAWAPYVSEGMLPNRFPDAGEAPEYNSVDAALWYVVAVHEFFLAARRARFAIDAEERRALQAAVDAILTGYRRGTRFGVRADGDGLLAAGEPGLQLTWMDARVNGRCITQRAGKPVEVQALWLNCLWLAGATDPQWRKLFDAGRRSFEVRFWNSKNDALFDVVDCDHRPGTVDATFRPNQILAVGGLPLPMLEGARARAVVDAVEGRLLTPLGLRSLAPGEPGYCGRYCGGPEERDAVYHQGPVWPWLAGPFIDAWVRVRGKTPTAKAEARMRFVEPLLAHLDAAGLGHVSEIADGDAPHTPRGCPFQAWSVGELVRVQETILPLEDKAPAGAASKQCAGPVVHTV
ncbi:MAG TPA: amylo-alpha-1,6-glucosidase [Tepidisphaeraceae bacterium]|jgi:predicted glycogen debranching enzyme